MRSSYNSQPTVDRLSLWYTQDKEQEFIRFLFQMTHLPPSGPIVEIGGGPGVHGVILQSRFKDRYLHTDYAEAMVQKAHASGLNTRVVDGLNMPFDEGSVAAILCVAATTIINDAERRNQQFSEIARVLSPNGVAILVTSRLAFARKHHCLDKSDIANLAKKGMHCERFISWGLIPGRHWTDTTSRAFCVVEGFSSKLGLGIRRCLVVRKNQDQPLVASAGSP